MPYVIEPMTIEDLADNAGVTAADLQQFERNGARLNKVGMAALVAALGNAGIEFLPEEGEHGAGLRRRTPEFELQPFHGYPEGVGLGARNRGRRCGVHAGHRSSGTRSVPWT